MAAQGGRPAGPVGGPETGVQTPERASELAAAEAVRAGAIKSPRCGATRPVLMGIVSVCSEPLGHYGPHYDREGMFAYWCACGWILKPEDVQRTECPACGASW